MSTSLIGRFVALNARVGALADRSRSPLLLVLRLYWGWQFFDTGRGKLGNLDGVTQYFESLGIPAPGMNAAVAAATECFGGLLLMLGLGSRLVAVPLAFTMVVAFATAHRESLGSVLSDSSAFLTQLPLSFLLVAAVVVACGPGAFSVDRLLESWSGRESAKGRGAL